MGKPNSTYKYRIQFHGMINVETTIDHRVNASLSSILCPTLTMKPRSKKCYAKLQSTIPGSWCNGKKYNDIIHAALTLSFVEWPSKHTTHTTATRTLHTPLITHTQLLVQLSVLSSTVGCTVEVYPGAVDNEMFIDCIVCL
jgi:hypothetical protein